MTSGNAVFAIKEAWAKALFALLQYQALYTRWEPLWVWECQATMKSLLATQALLQQWQSFFEGTVVGEVYSKQTALLIVKLQSLDYLQERIDEAAIAVRSYQPICECETQAAFRMQKYARDRLKILINGVSEVIDLMNELFPEAGVTVVEVPPLMLSEHKE